MCGIETAKTCRSCGIEKHVSQFYKAAWSPDGYAVVCRECISAQSAERWKRNPRDPDVNRRKAREWHAANREYVSRKNKSRYEETKEQQKERSIKWRRENIERARSTARHWNHKKWERHATGNCRARAKRKGVPFDMEPSDLFDPATGKLPIRCPIFPHIVLDYAGGPDRRKWPSVDRKVPELGYVTGNVWVVSIAANLWKSNGSSAAERKRIVALMAGSSSQNKESENQLGLFGQVD